VWTTRNVTVQTERDLQNDFHVDTFHNIVKVWLFQDPPGVALEEGPLMFARGSHRNSHAKLQWMHVYAQPPATEAVREPSFRLRGCESATRGAADYVRWVEEAAVPVLPLPGTTRTIVIASTSALHARGEGIPGRTRHSWRLAGETDGGLVRLDPFRWWNECGEQTCPSDT